MVAKYGGPQGGFLVAYFALLFLCFSVSMVQGSVGFYVGLASLICCCFVFFGWFACINYRFHRKCLKVESLDKQRCSGEEKGKSLQFS
jgi:hypothetical protein